jgi:regulator of PEP synthase PpsR (kinase-PPPase family)
MPNRRAVFFISDRTGITVEMLGNSLLTQFEGYDFQRRTIPFVDTPEKVAEAVAEINATGAQEGRRPIVFSSLVDQEMSEQLAAADAQFLDFFQAFIAPLEVELGGKSSHAAGRSHGVANSHVYFSRIEAINYTMAHDDGSMVRDLASAQVILVGVSRSGKTPTSLYLALQFGIRAANFPLTPEDFAERRLPQTIVPYRDKLFGLTINPERLTQIRSERRPASTYAQLSNCQYEVRAAELLMSRERIPFLDTTTKSIEEIASTILHRAKLARNIF